jgi:hypothetical protein
LGQGKGGEMTQTLYAHMNKRKKKEKKINKIFLLHMSLIVTYNMRLGMDFSISGITLLFKKFQILEHFGFSD